MNASSTADHLNIGGVFQAAGEIFKRSFGRVWIVALIILIPAEVIVGLLGNGGIMGTIGTLVHWAAIAWLSGSVVRIVQNVENDGYVDMGIGEILGSVTPLLISLILLEIVLGVLITIGTLLFIIPGVILALMWCVAIPAMVVEGLGVFDSMGRSSDLTRKNRMRILAVGLLIFLALIGMAAVVVFLSLVNWIIGAIAGIILGVVIYPYVSILAAVLYYRLRDLKEGAAAGSAVQETIEDPGAPPVA